MTDPDPRHRADNRRQVVSLLRRFVPVALVAATVACLVVFAPDQHRVGTAAALPANAAGSDFTAGGTAPAAKSSAPASGATTGTAVNGTRCVAGARQFTFIAYSPWCEPAFTGNNGGATAHGVTATTITFAVRKSSDYDIGKVVLGLPPFDAVVHDMTVLADALNKQYELYGRKVVIKSFSGRGGLLSETEGQGQAAAAADAQTAYDQGAFASGVGPPDSTVFQDALSSRDIVSLALPGPTAAGFTAAYPYQYPQAIAPIPDVQAQGAATLVCQRLANLPAVFAGDSGYRSQQRTFGMIMSQNDAEAKGGNKQVPGLVKQKCGATVKTYVYSESISTIGTDSKRIATQLKSDGVTTALLFGNLQFSPAMTSAAVQNAYYPEWLDFDVNRNATARQMNAKAVENMVFVYPWHPQSFAPDSGECYQIYKQADPKGEPESDMTAGGIFDNTCANMLQIYGALQAAGPKLTPATFGAGWFHQPASKGTGDFGGWSHSTQFFGPEATFTLQYWSPGVANPYDGGSGLYVACKEPADIGYLSSKMGSGQLKCLGR